MRKFRINQFIQPELFVTGDFDTQNYSPGESVKGKVKVRKPDAQALQQGSSISYEIKVKTSTGSIETISKKLMTLNY
jgi:uncharacterized protein YfaS (alpha-2-macroglobulin family)